MHIASIAHTCRVRHHRSEKDSAQRDQRAGRFAIAMLDQRQTSEPLRFSALPEGQLRISSTVVFQRPLLLRHSAWKSCPRMLPPRQLSDQEP
jgi:hypothetical protein